VVRFDAHQRLQHFLMMSSFIALALTGLPQKFSDLGVSQWWVSSLGGLETVRWIHRGAGLVMLSDCLYHLVYLAYRIGVQGRMEPLGMIPTLKDLRQAAQSILYYLGLAPEKPRFGRYSYLEKFDYWAVFWGIAMIRGGRRTHPTRAGAIGGAYRAQRRGRAGGGMDSGGAPVQRAPCPLGLPDESGDLHRQDERCPLCRGAPPGVGAPGVGGRRAPAVAHAARPAAGAS